ncbi:hypothetical protein EXIGLDRAFT_729686 [Exidia glandulosa HHB12029]|uniref:Uncharacterized protein n=1 Tax=Exidia glandulosa HHB12029 TaxID=1314781 RepID=A0A165CHG4_EXIGL|nr:hypothetical protein EXIGLDRAFT_729686 [Exidia glandulosa HHB12029]
MALVSATASTRRPRAIGIGSRWSVMAVRARGWALNRHKPPETTEPWSVLTDPKARRAQLEEGQGDLYPLRSFVPSQGDHRRPNRHRDRVWWM